MPIIDGSGIQDFDPIPEGTYNARFSKFENKPDHNGVDGINTEYTVEDDEFAGRKLFKYQSLKAGALWSLKQAAVALGADGEDFKGKFDTDAILEPLVGNECRIVVGTQEDGDFAGRNQIDRVLAPAYSLR